MLFSIDDELNNLSTNGLFRTMFKQSRILLHHVKIVRCTAQLVILVIWSHLTLFLLRDFNILAGGLVDTK